MSLALHDVHYMRSALDLARRGLGFCAPNPSVGCVIVKNGIVIGRGVTGIGGRPHAETQALAQAGAAAQGADIYVTLEPCAHVGQTGSCAQAIIAAKAARVIVAMEDPDMRTNGQGIAMLRDAGVQVELSCCAEDAAEVNPGFILTKTAGRPMVTLKIATTLDGRIATSMGESQWITGEDARRYAHFERSCHDAVMIGAGTALADHPQLTTRLDGVCHHGIRIVCDTHLRLPLDLSLFQSVHDAPVWVFCGQDAPEEKRGALESLGVCVMPVSKNNTGRCDLPSMLTYLAENGVTRLLVEGGAKLLSNFIMDGLYDRLLWFRAPSLIGGDGTAAIDPLGVAALSDQKTFKNVSYRKLGADLLEIYSRLD